MKTLYQRLVVLDEPVAQADRWIEPSFKPDERGQRLAQAEGIGSLIATAFRAAIGGTSVFHTAR
jgi:hypothetical protein